MQVFYKSVGVLVLSLLLTGCSYNNSAPVASADSESLPVPNYTVIEVDSKVDTIGNTVYKSGDTIPILTKGKVLGWLKINQVERIGVSDLYQEQAVKNGIDYSYSMNFAIQLAEPLEKGKDLTIKVEPYLIQGDKELGVPCMVGWNGFPQEAEFFDSTKDVWMEIGLQPLVKKAEKNTELVLKIIDSSSTEYDVVRIDTAVLKNAKKGNSLVIDKKATIEYVNKAKISIKFGKVIVDECRDSEHDYDTSRYYAASYTAKYVNAPGNKRKQASFDDESKMFSPRVIVAVTSDVDSTVLRNSNYEALYAVYDDFTEWTRFATAVFNPLNEGESSKITFNRKLPDTTTIPAKVRFSLEFPEEVSARTREELLQFNGRYVVFQKDVEEKVWRHYYE